MSHETDPIPPFDDPDREREWRAQENALRHERLRLDPAGDDARLQRYRLLVRALRTPPADGLPADFAQHVGARVAAVARAPSPPIALESALLVALAGVLLLAAVIVTVQHGATWWPAVAAALHAAAATPWSLPLIACLALSWAFGAWQNVTTKR